MTMLGAGDLVASASAPVGPCRLCGVVGALEDSHIVSRWVYKRVGRLGGGQNAIIQIRGKIGTAHPGQGSEYLLCRSCEDRLEPAERYLSEISVQEDGTFPAFDLITPLPGFGPEAPVADARALDCSSIAYFAASVAWRASVSRHYPEVSLGSYEDTFADYLLGRGPFPSSTILVVELVRPPAGQATRPDFFALAPYESRHANGHVHEFTIVGVRFRLFVGRWRERVPALEPFSLAEHKRILLTDGQKVSDLIREAVQESTPKGKARKAWGL